MRYVIGKVSEQNFFIFSLHGNHGLESFPLMVCIREVNTCTCNALCLVILFCLLILKCTALSLVNISRQLGILLLQRMKVC